MSIDEDQERGSLVAPGKREMEKSSSALIGRELESVEITENDPKNALFPVFKRGKAGYINKDGKIMIGPQFDRARHFSEGLAPIRIGDTWGYIDKIGRIVISLLFDIDKVKNGGEFYHGSFCEGLARVEVGGKWRVEIVGK